MNSKQIAILAFMPPLALLVVIFLQVGTVELLQWIFRS